MNIRATLLHETVTPRRWERVFEVPPTLSCFAGHFPGFPIVPAVVQISWVMDLAHVMLIGHRTLASIDALKFTAPIQPGDTVHLSAESSPDGSSLSFRLWSGERVFSSGRCRFVVTGQARS